MAACSNWTGQAVVLLAIFFSIAATFLLIAYLLHKVREVHLSTYKMLEDLSVSRREVESLFPQIQALLALERKLALNMALPPLRGWAGSPDFLLEVADNVTSRKPNVVMECSSGVSTLVIARCLQLNGRGHLYSLEHNPQYAGITRENLRRFGLVEWATVIDAPLEREGSQPPWYARKAIPDTIQEVEMLVVDGPPSPIARHIRYPAIPRLIERFASNAIVMLDDADRADEREAVDRWLNEYPGLTCTRLNCEKGLAVVQLNRN